MESPVRARRERYIRELESGNHHSGVPRDAGKRVRNSVFVRAARAAGYSEATALEHAQKIDKKIGEVVVWEAFQRGFLLENPPKKNEEKKKKEQKMSLEAQREFFSGPPEFGNDAHLGLCRISSVVGEKGVRFVQLRPKYPSDRAAMLAAGFTEMQAQNPRRLLEKIGKLSGREIMDALAFLRVDSVKIAEIIEDFLTRKEVVTEERLDEFGNVIFIKKEQYQGAAVNAGLSHLKDFMRLTREEGGREDEDVGILVNDEVVARCSGLLRSA